MSLAPLCRRFGAEVVSSRPMQGGDLSEVLDVTLSDGQRLAVKRGPRVAVEARMLQAMAAAGAPVPQVLDQQGTLLCLEMLPTTRCSPEGWRALGAGLRRLHADNTGAYGWPEGYGFGPLELDNAPRETWPGFWAEARLLPFLPHLPGGLARRVETLAATLPDRLPGAPPPALLHGDLWTGNVLFGDWRAWMIDPACYRGDPEVDLAMLELFGLPPDSFWQGYGPVEPDRGERRPLYQLFPALVHYRLFGASYEGMVTGLLDRAGA